MRKKIKNQFTLIEVAVVLLVLVALAGLVVPLALGYAQRSHGSTGAGNIAQLTANINRFEVENFEMPDGWDNLVDSTGVNVHSAFLAVSALDDGEAASLFNAGINTVHPVVNAGGTEPYSTFADTGAGVELFDGTNTNNVEVARLDGATVNAALGASNDAADNYVALGIGSSLSAIGKTIASAPYDFPEGAEKPEESYRRFAAVFRIADSGTAVADAEKAKFVGVVAIEEDSVANIQDHINEYYEATE